MDSHTSPSSEEILDKLIFTYENKIKAVKYKFICKKFVNSESPNVIYYVTSNSYYYNHLFI
jgi:hypothetical protein